MAIRLNIEVGGNRLKVFIKRSATFGRSDEKADFVLNDPNVSSKHFELKTSEGRILVKDLGSKNGTYINGKKIESEENLYVYDIISVGNIKISIDTKALTTDEFNFLTRPSDPNYWGENITDLLKTSNYKINEIKKKSRKS